MNYNDGPESKMTALKAQDLLRKGGMSVTLEEAKNILQLLTILAKLEVQDYLKNKKSNLK